MLYWWRALGVFCFDPNEDRRGLSRSIQDISCLQHKAASHNILVNARHLFERTHCNTKDCEATRMRLTSRWLLCCRKIAVQLRLCHELSLLVKSGILLSRRKPLLELRQCVNGYIFLKDAISQLLLIRKLSRSCSRKRTLVKLKMLKLLRGVWS